MARETMAWPESRVKPVGGNRPRWSIRTCSSQIAGVAQAGQARLAVGRCPAKARLSWPAMPLGALVFQQAGPSSSRAMRVLGQRPHQIHSPNWRQNLWWIAASSQRAVQQGQNLARDLGHYQLLLRQPQRVPPTYMRCPSSIIGLKSSGRRLGFRTNCRPELMISH